MPSVNGVRLRSSDASSHIDIEFSKMIRDWNISDAREVVVFGADIGLNAGRNTPPSKH